MPVEIDERQRKITQLEIEREALRKEPDRVSKERVSSIEKELSTIKETFNEMKARWLNEKDMIQAIRKVKEELEQIGIEEQLAEREGNYARVAEIRYSKTEELKTLLRR